MLAAWDDSLQRASDLSAVAAYDAASRHGSGRAGELRRALFLIRSGDLADARTDVELALTNAEQIANHTRWPAPDFVLARGFAVLAAKHWIEKTSDGKELAETHDDAVWRTLKQSLDRDPTFSLSRKLLGQLTAAGGDRFLRPAQVSALQREVALRDADPDALLAWGRHLRTLQDYPSALAALDRAVAQGGDGSRLDLERARTAFAAGHPTNAVAAYWSGLEHLTATGREMYRFDLAWITEPGTLNEFDGIPDSLVPSWMATFWASRDAEAGNQHGARLVEHLRRWNVVLEKYRVLSPWRRPFFSRVEPGFDNGDCSGTDASFYQDVWSRQPSHPGDLRSREQLLDNRGLVYLRHGEPQRRISDGGGGGSGLPGGPITEGARRSPWSVGRARKPDGTLFLWSARGLGEAPDRPTGPGGETWLYGLGDEWHILRFRGSLAYGKYAPTTLTQQVAPSWFHDPALVTTLPGTRFQEMAARLVKWLNDPVFGPPPPGRTTNRKVDPPGCFTAVRAVAAQMHHDERAFLGHDTDAPPELRPSNSVAQVFALGTGDDQSGEALIAFAIASEALRADSGTGTRAGYTITFHVVAFDSATGLEVRLDTLRHFTAARRLEPGEFLTSHLELGLPTGRWNVAVRAEQPTGIVAINDAHLIQVDSASRLQLSDIVTGRPDSPSWLATDNQEFPVNYTNGWHTNETAELFYEVRGVPAGEPYRTTVTLRPHDPKMRTTIQIQSTDAGTGPVTYVRKSLGLNQLAPGKYLLVVTVEYRGAKAVRERQILIVKP